MAKRQVVGGKGILDLLHEIQMSPQSTLPDILPELTELGISYANGENPRNLPESISICRKVEKIFARGNNFTSLPQSIGNLQYLTLLHLDENAFTELPTVLYSLNNLETLYLSNNQISHISVEINRMHKLRAFWLSHNAFTTFPINLCGLTNLKELYLDGNRVSEIPAEINRMALLKRLNLASNNITHLPPQIKTMTNLTDLDVTKNPLVQPPMHIAKRGVGAIRSYFEAFTDLQERGLDLVTIAEDRGKEASIDVKRTIPEKLKNDLLRFEFVDMFGFGQDSFQIYVCRKHFGSNTDLDVINKLKTLVEEHEMDGKVVAHISSAPRRLSYFCGKEPPGPAAQIVKDTENDRYGSFASYCCTDEENSKVYVLTNAHVAREGDIRLIQSGRSQLQSVNVCMHQRKGKCNWSISPGTTPSFVDIAALEVPSLGLPPGVKSVPAISVFSGDVGNVVGQPVYKHGAQSNRTEGTLVGFGFVSRDENSLVCEELLRVQGQNGDFSFPGDSGSLVRLAEDNKPLAMIVGGKIEMRPEENENNQGGEGNGNNQGNERNGKNQGNEGNENNQGDTTCFLLSEGLMELERKSGKAWKMVDETQLQCLIEKNFNVSLPKDAFTQT